jgi:hypothetical protein
MDDIFLLSPMSKSLRFLLCLFTDFVMYCMVEKNPNPIINQSKTENKAEYQ